MRVSWFLHNFAFPTWQDLLTLTSMGIHFSIYGSNPACCDHLWWVWASLSLSSSLVCQCCTSSLHPGWMPVVKWRGKTPGLSNSEKEKKKKFQDGKYFWNNYERWERVLVFPSEDYLDCSVLLLLFGFLVLFWEGWFFVCLQCWWLSLGLYSYDARALPGLNYTFNPSVSIWYFNVKKFEETDS